MKNYRSDTKSSSIRRRQIKIREDEAEETLADQIGWSYVIFIISITIYSIQI